MDKIIAWMPTIIALIGVFMAWGGMRRELKGYEERYQKQLAKDIETIKAMLISSDGMPNYVTRTEWNEWCKAIQSYRPGK